MMSMGTYLASYYFHTYGKHHVIIICYLTVLSETLQKRLDLEGKSSVLQSKSNSISVFQNGCIYDFDLSTRHAIQFEYAYFLLSHLYFQTGFISTGSFHQCTTIWYKAISISMRKEAQEQVARKRKFTNQPEISIVEHHNEAHRLIILLILVVHSE